MNPHLIVGSWTAFGSGGISHAHAVTLYPSAARIASSLPPAIGPVIEPDPEPNPDGLVGPPASVKDTENDSSKDC